MRILVMVSRIPYPPLRGDRLRTWNIICALSRHHEVDLITFLEGDEDDSQIRALERHASVTTVRLSRFRSYLSMMTRALSPLPFQVSYYRSRAMRRAVDRALASRDYDLVYVHLFRMAPFVLDRSGKLARRRPDQRFVLDLTDAISAELEASVPMRPVLLRPLYSWEVRKIAAYEGRVAKAFDDVWAISRADADEILRLGPGAPVTVLANGVDRSLLDLPVPGAARAVDGGGGLERRSAENTTDEGGGVVLFVGNLSIPHNVDAVTYLAREVMPLVRERRPAVRLRIVGHAVSPPVEDLAALPWTDVVGYVPELKDAYRGSDVFAAPLRFAAGVQNKVIEAMASGLPAVVTSIVNRGIEAGDGEELVVRDGTYDFASAIVDLLSDPQARARIGLRGREFVSARYSWEATVERVEKVVSGRP